MNKADRATTKARLERRRVAAEAFKGLPPDEKLAYIAGPNVPPTEFEIQAFLYAGLDTMGCFVRGEVGTKCGSCVFDLVIYNGATPVQIIEVKKNRRPACFGKAGKKRAMRQRLSQIERYKAFGVPVAAVSSMSEAEEFLKTMTQVE